MIKKFGKILIKILLILLICQTVNVPLVRADYWDQTIDDANKFIDKGKSGLTEEAVSNDNVLKSTVNKVYNIILALGIILAAVLGGILGIQIMWGSVEQKVNAKEMLWPYASGCFVVFGAFAIWRICIVVFSQL